MQTGQGLFTFTEVAARVIHLPRRRGRHRGKLPASAFRGRMTEDRIITAGATREDE
jgi:hypothetical protein